MKQNVHIICIRPKIWKTGLLCFLMLVGLLSFQSPITEKVLTASATARQLPIYSVDHSDALVSISFDAAWGNEDTEELIDILAKYDVFATFFVVGEWAEKYPESVLALYEAGHEVMNHSDNHAHYPQLSAENIVADLNACNDKVEAITGVRPTLVRLPYGDYDDKVIATIRSMGMEPIQWDVDSHDWMDISSSAIATRVIENVTAGSIVLFHNAAINTPEALPTILERLQGDGYTFVKISEILLEGDYTIDHTGKQCSAFSTSY